MVRWRAESDDGLEHSVLVTAPDGIAAHGVVIGDRDGLLFGLGYRVRGASDRSVRSVIMQTAGGDPLDLVADGHGTWKDAAGAVCPDLAGCIDVDLAATSFTNTSPIPQLALAHGEHRVIRVFYVSTRSLRARPVERAYTCVDPGRRYRYENLSSGFVAEPQIDADGLVLDYPGVFRRR